MEDKEVQTDEKSIAKPSLRSSSVSEVRKKNFFPLHNLTIKRKGRIMIINSDPHT